MLTLKNQPALNDHMLRSQRLVFRASITGHATPASKVHVTDVPQVVLRSAGKTATADAVETLTWTTAADGTNSTFGMLINLGGNEAAKVQKVTVTEITSLATSFTVRGPNASVDGYLTTNGNIAIEIVGTGLDLTSESPTFVVEVEYLEAR
jgi:hypothetical protein